MKHFSVTRSPRGILFSLLLIFFCAGAVSPQARSASQTTFNGLGYSTLLGGDFSEGHAVAVDARGNAYILGETDSPPLPGTTKLVKASPDGTPGNVFITKLDGQGRLVYSTLLTGQYFCRAIAVDHSGSVYVAGKNRAVAAASGDNLLATPKAFQESSGGGNRPFIIKLNPAGDALVYATYLGGSSDDYITDIVADESGSAYVTGIGNSPDFPTTPGAFRRAAGTNTRLFSNYFVSKLNHDGSALVYSTCLGGTEYNDPLPSLPTWPNKLAVDPQGNVYVGGCVQYEHYYFDPAKGRSATVSQENRIPATPGAFQAEYRGDNDAFVMKLNGDGSRVIFSTYLGGSHDEDIRGMALDGDGNIYVAGNTYSSDFPTTPGAYQLSSPSDPGDGRLNKVTAFVSKLDAKGGKLLYSTYLGGKTDIYCTGLVIDPAGKAYVTGATGGGFPVTADAFQKRLNRGGRPFDLLDLLREEPLKDFFLSALSRDGSALLYSTYFGGYDDDLSNGIATDGVGGIYITGYTTSHNFPLTRPAVQSKIAKIKSAFAVRFN